MEQYIDTQVLAQIGDDDYLVVISKEDLARLVSFHSDLVVRHWDGEKPVILVPYGESAVRTVEDSEEANNLAELPRLKDVASVLG